MSANVTSEMQGSNQAREAILGHLDDISSASDTSCASSVEAESLHGSSESNLIDAENHELDDGGVHLWGWRSVCGLGMPAFFAAAVERQMRDV